MFDFETLYNLVSAGRHARVNDMLFEYVDDQFSSSRFSMIDDLLLSIDIERLDPFAMAGLLSCTFPARNKLKNRQTLLENIGHRLQALGRTDESIKRLLKGLE